MKKTTLLCMLTLLAITATTALISCQTSPPTPPTSSISPSTSVTSQIPDTPQGCYERGIELKNKQQSALALLAFAKAIKLDPNYAEAYYELSKLLPYEGEWDKTIANCSRAISLKPNYPEAYYMRGLARMIKKQYDTAILDLNMAVEMEPSKQERSELKKVTNLIIPPGELILLHTQLSVGGGRDCRGNYMPYNNSVQIQLFVNPVDAGVEVDKIYLNPPLGGKSEINSPIRYFNNLGLQYLVICISSESPPTSAPSCKIDYKSKSSSVYKKSNEISNAKIIVEPSELVCPTN